MCGSITCSESLPAFVTFSFSTLQYLFLKYKRPGYSKSFTSFVCNIRAVRYDDILKRHIVLYRLFHAVENSSLEYVFHCFLEKGKKVPTTIQINKRTD